MEKRLLIIDDDVDIVVLIFDLLTDLFDIIDTAYTVDEACKILSENTYTVILLDINLQYRNGGEVFKFVIDDKGILLLAIWGLTPLAHTDDPVRSILGTLAVAENIEKILKTKRGKKKI